MKPWQRAYFPGNVISPYFFRPEEQPIYRTAFILQLVFGALAASMAFGTKFWLKKENRKLQKKANETGTTYNPYVT
jgi:hypothetical protein